MDAATMLLNSLIIITPFAVVDAAAFLPSNLVCITPLLGTRRPVLVASAYTTGMFLGGVASGFAVAFALQEITAWFVENMDAITRPGPMFLALQAVIGLALVMTGVMLFRSRPPPNPAPSAERAAGGVTLVVVGAFTFALVSMFTRLPVALPYLATVDRLLKMPTPATMKLVGLAYHNLVLVAPYLLLLALFLIAPARSERLLAAIQRWLRTRGRMLIATLLIALGAVLAADAVGSRFGHPILPVIEIRDEQRAQSDLDYLRSACAGGRHRG